MCHKKIRIPRESANETMRALGNLEDGVEFVDLTQDDIEAKKNFSQMLKRCDDMIKKINDFNSICEDFHLETENFKSYQEFNDQLTIDLTNKDKKYGSTYFDFLESEIMENDKQLRELVDNLSTIREDLITLIEKKYVLEKTSELITSNNSILIPNSNFSKNIEDEIINTSSPSEPINPINVVDNLSFIAAVVKFADQLRMKRMIFRISRGRAIASFYNLNINDDEYLYTSSVRHRGFSFANKNTKSTSLIKEHNILDNKQKVIFNILFQGGVENVLLGKILKICEMFQASRYNVPKREEIQFEIRKIEDDIVQKKNLLVQTEKSINDMITRINQMNDKSIKYSLYRLYFLEEKMIYFTLNKCIVRENFIDGEIWVPERTLSSLINNINAVFQGKDDKLRANIEGVVEENDFSEPPTYIPTNEFLYAFQEVTNTYGIPRYREINPGLFNVITFPFLFGVMFGDICHSLFIFAFALFICIKAKNLESGSILKSFLPFRYFLLLMGFFGMFCGFMYNDFASVPINFPTCYTVKIEGDPKNNYNEYNKTDSCNYKFGLDPIWAGSLNELTVINSLKMKLSVILGVLHMILGILLKGLNSIFIGDYVEFFFVFIPEIILMSILFGYMDVLILLKWNKLFVDSRKAPDIKGLMMDIFLKPMGKIDEKYDAIWGNHNKIQFFHSLILILSMICVSIMIIPTVIGKKIQSDRKFDKIQNKKRNLINNEEYAEKLLEDENKDNENSKASFSDVFVGVLIDSIEFVLGTVSNTASYLRLWALSLAHSQLSKVCFQYTVGMGALTPYVFINIILLSFSGIIAFCVLTGGVLLFMDVMECFLHTLRLHWVEFQNKFYHGDGHLFMPFCFNTNLPLNEDSV